MNVLSLFDGISCGMLAMKRAGIECNNYYASEIDKYAIEVSRRNFPDIVRLGDITKLDCLKLNDIDIVIGESPCQSFSRSGDNTGFEGKSGLFYEYLRCLNEVKPRWFLLENVVMKKEWENQISQFLGVSPVMIDSAMFSAQKRQRLYWTNIPFDKNIPDMNISISDIYTSGYHKVINNHPVIIKNDNGVFYVRNATKIGFATAHDGDCVNLEVPNSKTRRGRVSQGKTNTLNTACNYGFVVGSNLVELNITEYERLQTLPDGYTSGIPLSARKKVIGNGWTVDVIAHILKGISNEK